MSKVNYRILEAFKPLYIFHIIQGEFGDNISGAYGPIFIDINGNIETE